MSGKNEHLIKVTPVWSAWVIAAENVHFLFQGDKPNDSEVRAICSPKRLGKQEK